MMTCNQCLYQPICDAYANMGITDSPASDISPCELFKNKADFVEVKHGEWFVDDFPKQDKKFITCSECRSVIDCNVTYIDENEYDYCPYCGADMRKEGADNG